MTENPFAGYDVIVVLGPTACGKTNFACQLAARYNGEIISADSRQVYRHLTIGTGKDLNAYQVNGQAIPYHLIDIADPDTPFYLHQFQAALFEAIQTIRQKGKLPIVCGGTGLYLSALYTSYELTAVPENEELRNKLRPLDKNELIRQLNTFPEQWTKHVDRQSAKRLIRGIEVATYLQENHLQPTIWPSYTVKYLGLSVSKETRIERISKRLRDRINEGLIAEGEHLLKMGITHERLQFLGLEYKQVSHYLLGQCDKETFIKNLETAIIQYAKRQMTWFRKMEKEVAIEWIDPLTSPYLL